MKWRWTKPGTGLPPGQRLFVGEMPRFGDRPRLPPPAIDEIRIEVTKGPETLAVLDADSLGDAVDQTADFHCVTTWSVQDITWSGVPLSQVLSRSGLTSADGAFLAVQAGDERRGHFLWEDATQPNVMLVTHMNGERLTPRRGGPVRLVAPDHYGYKSIKHVIGIDVRDHEPSRLGKEHLRGRVAHEERHPTMPSRLLRLPYRMMIPMTAALAERSARIERRPDQSTRIHRGG